MAEILGIVASGISVVQIAGQLLKCIQQLRNACRSIREFPRELQESLNEIQILGEAFQSLQGLRIEQFGSAEAVLLHGSVAHCNAVASSLENVLARVNKPQLGKASGRAWLAVKVVLKKDEISDLKRRLDDARSLLHLAMTCCSL